MDISKKDIKAYRAFAESLAYGAGNILKDGFKKDKKVKFKGSIDPVTQFDLKSEKYIISRIKKNFRSHSILAEEGTDKETTSGFRWVVDPLDGTVNYSHRFPIYSVSIGLQYKDETIVGVVYDPHMEEMYSAGLGSGATLNGKKLKVSDEKDLSRSLLATGFAYNIRSAKRNNLGMFARMMKKAQAVRRLGSAALDLCWVAAGRLEGFWEYNLAPWDTAAAILIVTEAGGKVTKIDLGKYSIFSDQLLASNSLIHKQMADVLGGKKA